MLRLRALVLERDARAVLRDWGEAGAVQLTRTAPGPDAAPLAPRDCGAELARCHRLLARVSELRRTLETSPGTSATFCPICYKRLSLALDAEEPLRLMETRAGELLQRRQRLTERLAELTSTCGQLSPYHGLDRAGWTPPVCVPAFRHGQPAH
jgi:hypothetical protein